MNTPKPIGHHTRAGETLLKRNLMQRSVRQTERVSRLFQPQGSDVLHETDPHFLSKETREPGFRDIFTRGDFRKRNTARITGIDPLYHPGNAFAVRWGKFTGQKPGGLLKAAGQQQQYLAQPAVRLQPVAVWVVDEGDHKKLAQQIAKRIALGPDASGFCRYSVIMDKKIIAELDHPAPGKGHAQGDICRFARELPAPMTVDDGKGIGLQDVTSHIGIQLSPPFQHPEQR